MGMSPIGRAVTFEDMLAIHRQCKDCLGRCRFTVQRPRQAPRLEYCGRAIEDMTVLTAMGRIVNGPGGDAPLGPGLQPRGVGAHAGLHGGPRGHLVPARLQPGHAAPLGAAMLNLTTAQLSRVWRYAPVTRINAQLPYLLASLARAQVNTSLRLAMYLAQLGHECAEGRYLEELASGAAYEGRKDLGNLQPGDGQRFKGRGAIQLTGRANYAAAGAALGLDLVARPELAATLPNAFELAAWFWARHALNGFADAGDVDGATRRINGGLNGLAERLAYYDRAREVLAV
jgi:putative chitinase